MAKFCIECGEPVLEKAKFCQRCGIQITGQEAQSDELAQTQVTQEVNPIETSQTVLKSEPSEIIQQDTNSYTEDPSTSSQEHESQVDLQHDEENNLQSTPDADDKKSINYLVMIPSAFIGWIIISFLGLILGGDTPVASFPFMVFIFPIFMLVGVYGGWFIGGKITGSYVNFWSNKRWLFGMIGLAIGLSFGMWLSANICNSPATTCRSEDTLEYVFYALFPGIIGLFVGIAFAKRRYGTENNKTS